MNSLNSKVQKFNSYDSNISSLATYNPAFSGYMYSINQTLKSSDTQYRYSAISNTTRYRFYKVLNFDNEYNFTCWGKEIKNDDGSVSCTIVSKILGTVSKDGFPETANIYNNAAYINLFGYLSGEEKNDNINDSVVKIELDSWYYRNLNNYSSYISDTLFCNDRTTNASIDESIISTNYIYGAFIRNYNNKTPSLLCSQQNDCFTVDDEEVGNGDLTYQIG